MWLRTEWVKEFFKYKQTYPSTCPITFLQICFIVTSSKLALANNFFTVSFNSSSVGGFFSFLIKGSSSELSSDSLSKSKTLHVNKNFSYIVNYYSTYIGKNSISHQILKRTLD